MTDRLRIEDKVYPNGSPYKRITFDGETLGGYAVVDGGFLPFGKRKPRKTEFDALLDCIGDKQRIANKMVDLLDHARDEVFERQHEFGASV